MKKLSLPLIIAIVILFMMGLLTLMSASNVYSMILRKNQFAMFNTQLIMGVVLLLVMMGLALIDYKQYIKLSGFGIIFALVLLIITRFNMPPVKDVHRWFYIGKFGFQTAEVAKLLLFVFIAAYIERKGEQIKDLKRGYLPIIFVIFLIAGLVVIQPSVSNTILIFAVAMAMLFAGGVRLSHFAATIALIAGGMVLVIRYFGYAAERFNNFRQGILTGEYDDQVNQALIGLGSGGWLGRGLGNSEQRNLHLPEAYGDFIFAIAGEEIGFVGTAALLLLYLVIFIIGMKIAQSAKDKFGQILAFGISFSFLMHAIIHVSVSVGLIPNTGIPLPFVSHGGTSLTMTVLSLSILLSISRTTYRDAQIETVQEKE